MVVPKKARVVDARAISELARHLTLALDEPLDFVGGQYLIFDSGVILEGGKLAKRAYSMFSCDVVQLRVEVVVRRVAAGPGSSFMHRVAVGAEIPFSGPWGKYLPDDSRVRPRTWVLATDTGISVALGLVRGLAFTPQLANTTLVWLVERDEDFVPESFVRERLPSGLGDFRVEPTLPVNHPERLDQARALIDRMLASARPDSVFLSGDGAIVFPVRLQLIQAGVPEGAIRVESFFHHQARKSA